MIRHLVLQGDTDLRVASLEVSKALRTLERTGACKFRALGVRNPTPDATVYAHRRIAGTPTVVRVVQDLALGGVWISIDAENIATLDELAEVITPHLPIVPREVIRENIPSFAEIPELVLLLALAARHAPAPEDIDAVRSALESAVPCLRSMAATAASILGGEASKTALQEAAGREKDEKVRRVMTATLHQFAETTQEDLSGLSPNDDPEAAFRLKW